MYRIISSRKDERTGIIYHRIETEHGELEYPYRSVRAAVSWPTASSPAYFCIAGCEDQKNSAQEYPIKILYEMESLDLLDFFKCLLAEAKRFHCGKIIADRSDQYLPHIEEFDRFCKKRETAAIAVVEPIYANHEYFESGRHLIGRWLRENSLKIPKELEILRAQFGILYDTDLLEKDVAVKFYAVNTLRLLLDYYNQSSTDNSMTVAEHKRLKAKYSRFGHGRMMNQ